MMSSGVISWMMVVCSSVVTSLCETPSQPTLPCRFTPSHSASAHSCCYLASPFVGAEASIAWRFHAIRGVEQGMLKGRTALKPYLKTKGKKIRIEPRAGLGDAVKKLWPFGKGNEEDQYKSRKDVWNSLVMLDQVTGGELQVLINALTATGLWKDLSTEGGKKKQAPVTIFAALNSAFARLPQDCLLADCVAALEDASKPPSKATLDELRASLLGSIADGRHVMSALEGKKTRIATRSGRSNMIDLLPGTAASDFADYVLDLQERRKVKVVLAAVLVSRDLQCSNGVIHIVDKLPDGVEPIVRASSSSSLPPPLLSTSSVSEAEANSLQQQLYTARARLVALTAQLECLRPLVEERRLSRDSVRELVTTFERQAADFASYQVRAEKDLQDARDTSTTVALECLVKVLDTFELAVAGWTAETSGETDIQDKYAEVNSQLLTLLENLGVQRVEAVGEVFDARYHEAVQMMESTDYGDQIVCKQYQRGYRIGQRLVRPALVIVSSGPGPTTPAGSLQLDNTTRYTSGDVVVVEEDSTVLNPKP